MGFIYKIIDLNKNKIVYVGQHKGNNKYYEGSGVVLNRYKKKYGTKKYRERFKLIEIEKCDVNMLDEKEIFWIKYYNTFNNGLNLTEGGYENLSRNSVKGRKFPIKSLKLKGLKRSIETKKLMSDSKKGKPVSDLCLKKGLKAKMKPVLQYDLKGNFIKEWESGKKACLSKGFNNVDGVSACCLGKQKTAFGFIWRFKEDKIEDKIVLEKRKQYKKRIGGGGAIKVTIKGITYDSKTEAMKKLKIGNITLNKLLYEEKNKISPPNN